MATTARAVQELANKLSKEGKSVPVIEGEAKRIGTDGDFVVGVNQRSFYDGRSVRRILEMNVHIRTTPEDRVWSQDHEQRLFDIAHKHGLEVYDHPRGGYVLKNPNVQREGYDVFVTECDVSMPLEYASPDLVEDFGKLFKAQTQVELDKLPEEKKRFKS